MREISISRFAEPVREVLRLAEQENAYRTLIKSAPRESLRTGLQEMTITSLSGGKHPRMPHDAECLLAALWLRFDFEHESHEIAQGIATPSGSFWHGILHRREPDPSNAKYWFARVGEHPIFAELRKDAETLLAGVAPEDPARVLLGTTVWNSALFVDLCTSGTGAAEALLALQQREWDLLFEYNYQKAYGR